MTCAHYPVAFRASGGIGRRAGFRCLCPQGRGGSSPPSPTPGRRGGGLVALTRGRGRMTATGQVRRRVGRRGRVACAVAVAVGATLLVGSGVAGSARVA